MTEHSADPRLLDVAQTVSALMRNQTEAQRIVSDFAGPESGRMSTGKAEIWTRLVQWQIGSDLRLLEAIMGSGIAFPAFDQIAPNFASNAEVLRLLGTDPTVVDEYRQRTNALVALNDQIMADDGPTVAVAS